jgi:hypothetical protein
MMIVLDSSSSPAASQKRVSNGAEYREAKAKPKRAGLFGFGDAEAASALATGLAPAGRYRYQIQ